MPVASMNDSQIVGPTKRKPRFRKSSNEENETKRMTGSARWTTGFSDWRTFIGSNI
jgi:hypothetical protein